MGFAVADDPAESGRSEPAESPTADPPPPLGAVGVVHAIYLAGRAGDTLRQVQRVRAVPDRGLEGDRYFLGAGSFSRWPGSGRAVTLIEQEALDAIRREWGTDLSGGLSRRNIVTAGISLAALDGRVFRVGTALLRGARLCAPCRYLERRIAPGLMEAMRGRGGLRADVLEAGEIAAADAIVLARPLPTVRHPRGLRR